MNIDYSKLRECDYVLTSSLSMFGCVIRYKTAGLKNIFNTNIANHVGMLVNIDGKLFIAEMVRRFQINSLKRCYLNQGYWGSRIVCVRRNPIYDYPDVRYNTNSKILSDYFETQGYDWNGVLSYLLPHIVKEDPNKYYCSEYIQKHAKQDGNSLTDKLRITPYDIQKSEKLTTVDGWQL